MRLIKNVIVYLIFLLSVNAFSQPGPSKYYFDGTFYFKDFKNKDISFKTKDSIYFFNIKNNMTFCSYEFFEGDSINKKHYLKLNNTEWYYIFRKKENAFFLRNLTNISFNEKDFSTKITVFEIYKKRRKMLIFFNLKGYKNHISLGSFKIKFREGTFEITDPENPQLVAIKEEEEK